VAGRYCFLRQADSSAGILLFVAGILCLSYVMKVLRDTNEL
jgi:hypothetical protein